MTACDIIIISNLKSVRCRKLFGAIVAKFSGGLRGTALDKCQMILCFLEQSERSYVIREHELKKLVKERESQ